VWGIRRSARSSKEQISVGRTTTLLFSLTDSLLIREALAVVCKESDIRHVKALIVGPPGTPYEFGFFEVCLLGWDLR
jgi:ubiquitin-protein ligase